MMRMRSIILLMLSALLTSCIAVVVAGAAVGTVGMVGYDSRDVATIKDDLRIFHKVHTAIVKDPRFQDSHISLSSFNQVVLLVGQTPAASLRVLAEKIAQNTAGVTRVYNEITVGSPLPLSEQTRDAWISSQVRSLMLVQKGLGSGSIRILTEDGAVYLMGRVTHQQANLAAHVARQVNEVQKVVKVFQYIPVQDG